MGEGEPKPRSAAEIYDFWKGKEIKVVNEKGQVETGWQVIGAGEGPTITINKPPAKGDYQNQTRVVPLSEFESWQN